MNRIIRESEKPENSIMNTLSLMSAAEKVRDAYDGFHPKLALIMGSGWREVTQGFVVRHSIDFASIPELGAPGV
ncbi:MAG: hypothetical protein WCI20_12265, partial [bacterium]